MGTRSTIAFIERRTNGKGKTSDTELVRIYQQYDGYPNGVGRELATWLEKKTIVNGFSMSQTDNLGFCNGIGCMAAQFIRDFKIEIGGLYITTSDDEEEYNYKVIVNENNNIIMEMYDWNMHKLFSGTPQRFLEAVVNCEFDE